MAEEVGSIFYTVDAVTDKLVSSTKAATRELDNLQAGFDSTDASSKRATKSANDAAGGLSKAGKAAADAAGDLRKVIAALDPAAEKTRQLDELQDKLSAAFNAGSISLAKYNEYLAKLDKQYDELNTGTKKASDASGGFMAKLTPLSAAIAGIVTAQSLKAMGELAEQFTLLQARIVRLTPDLDAASTTYSQLLTIAGQTGQTMPATVKLWETLTSSLKSLGATQGQVVSLTAELQKIGKIGGSSAEETANALRQLGQSLAGGTLQAEEYNSIVDQTPELIRQLAKASNMSMGEFRAAMLAGKISAQDLFDLLQKRTGDVDAEFKKLPRSVSDAANAITVQFGAALSVIDKATKASQYLAKAMDLVARGIQLSFNPTDADNFNGLLQERANILDLIATKTKRGDGTNVENARLIAINKEIKALQDAQVARQKAERDAQDSPTKATTTPKGSKEIQELQDKNALLKVQGEQRAVLAALQQANVSADSAEGKRVAELAAQNYKLVEAEKARNTAKTAGTAQAKKDDAAAAAAIVKENEDARKAYEANQKVIADLGTALADTSLKGEALAVAQAKAKLNKFATPEDVAEVERLTKAIQAQKTAAATKTLANTVDPQVGAKTNVDQQLADIATVEQAGIISAQRAAELKLAAETNYQTQVRAMQDQTFKAASEGNALLFNSIDALSQGATQSLAGLLSGTSSLKDALGGVANTVLNTVIGSFVQAGTEWVKQEIIKQAAVKATEATQVAGISAVAGVQAGTTAAIATETTGTAAATGTAVAGSMAPAAGLASIASFGGAAVIGASALLATMLIAKSFGGGRQYGGPVNAGSSYRVNETGAPEIFNAANGRQYMIPNQNGQVVSNSEVAAGGSGGSGNVQVNINNSNGSNVRTQSRQLDRQQIIDVFIDDMSNGGKTRKLVNQVTGTNSRGT